MRVAVLAVVVTLLLPGAALGADRNATVTPAAPAAWTGANAAGTNTTFDPQTGTPCTNNVVATRCDTTLLNVNVAPSFWADQGGGVEISARNFSSAADDFDLFIYSSNAAGDTGKLLASSAGPAGQEEAAAIQEPSGFLLVVVVYFDVNPAGQYDGAAQFFFRSKHPADIDEPGGLKDSLASDPGLGYRSHSEPHIAQSPTNPNLLVAASKMYNRDPDSLAEYEFKIGTYVSFDGGQSWRDLGPLDVCPMSDAPPSSWPNNRCYPADDPNVQGTGAEDPAGGTDFGEEYITSDVWVQFDDEGNAYAMVLDAPPFQGGAGWGMTLHRWDTPSQTDVDAGQTWSERIPINAYPQAASDPNFGTLDDKDTFAVNNAGPDGDGSTGTMVACWSLDTPTSQQIACERSTDGGRSWPDAPKPVSVTPNGVIGAHVIADTRDANTFYIVWLAFAGPAGGPDRIEFVKSIDGGVTWTAPLTAAQLTNVPSIFPRQAFRNLSIPIGGVGPNGELYVSYADYRPAPQPGDEDGQQADIMVIKSTDGGTTWGAPVKVNSDSTNADQFQPYLAVNKFGQPNVSFFDRRLDTPVPGTGPGSHPGNFFIDTWLARSPDGGASWNNVRVSHDSWDPSINPPISDSGQFIGDYQGMVADDCFAIPFVNDTHLANDPNRDPELDNGLPRSQFQEVFSWRVPNTAAFGGDGTCGASTQPPAQQQPTPPVTRPATTATLLSFLSRRLRVSRTGTTRVTLRCRSSRPCRITLQFLARRPQGVRIRIARRTFTLQAGQRRSVKVKLFRLGRRFLARSRTRTLTTTATARVSSAGRTQTVRRTVILTRARTTRARLKVFGP